MPGRLVAKDEIIRAVWPGLTVSDASIAQCVSEIRSALRDREQRIIRTVLGRGYLFAASLSRPMAGAGPTQYAAPAHTSRAAVAAPSAAPAPSESVAQPPAGELQQPGPVIAPQAAERRHLTALSCEWTEFAALAARLDPEDLRVQMAAFHQRCTDVIERHRGSVARSVDDGMLAYFGHPVASEHDAENAVRAGLELLDGAPRRLAGPVAGLRIGVASGVVVMGERAAERSLAVGLTPHLARRLHAAAEPGSLVIDDATRRLLGGLFAYGDAEPVALDGRTEPVKAWRVLAAGTTASRFEALRAERVTALVGRQEQVELLARRWQSARRHDGQVVLLSGEPGIGKSRLAAAMIDRIVAEPHVCVRWFCSPHHAGSALYPIIRQLECAAGIASGDDPAGRLDKLDALLDETSTSPQDRSTLADLLSVSAAGRYPALDQTPQERRRRTLDALMRRLEAQARRAPVMAVFEDIQWIDPTSLDLLGRMIESCARLRVLLVVTSRLEVTPPWVGQAHVTLLTLNRFAPRECLSLISQIADIDRLDSDLVDAIVTRSDGVPLFLEELTAAVLEAGASAAQDVPASLQAPLTARLDRLGPAREVAQIGAVIGRAFSADLVAAVAGRDEAELAAALDRLTESGLVLRQGTLPEATFVFRHALIRDAAYGALLREARCELHARIAETLLRHRPHTSDTEPEVLARHYGEAGLLPEATLWWRKAGEQALRNAAFEEAVAHLGKAIGIADRAARDGTPAITPAERLALQIAYGQALLWARSMDETIAAFAAARELAGGLEDRSERFSAYYGLWAGSLMRADLSQARKMAETFLRDAGPRTGSAEAGVAHRILGTTFWYLAELPRARVHLERALAIYDPQRDRGLAVRFSQDPGPPAMACLALTLWVLGEPDQARRLADQAVAQAAEGGHVPTLAYVRTFALSLALLQGDAERAQALGDTLVRLCSEHGLTHLAYASTYRLSARWRLGKQRDGLREMRRAIEHLRGRGARLGLPRFLTILAEMETQAGEVEAALTSIDSALAEAARSGESWYDAETHRARGEALLRRGPADLGAAEAAFRRAAAIAERQGARGFALRAARSLASL